MALTYVTRTACPTPASCAASQSTAPRPVQYGALNVCSRRPCRKGGRATCSFTVSGRAFHVYQSQRQRCGARYRRSHCHARPRVLRRRPDPHHGSGYPTCPANSIGNNQPAELMFFIRMTADALCQHATKKLPPMQSRIFVATRATLGDLKWDVGSEPKVDLAISSDKSAVRHRSHRQM